MATEFSKLEPRIFDRFGPFASLDPCRNVVEWKNPKGLQLWYCRQALPLLLPAGAGDVAVHVCSGYHTPWRAPVTPGYGLDSRHLGSLNSDFPTDCSNGKKLASTWLELNVARRVVTFNALFMWSSWVVVVDRG